MNRIERKFTELRRGKKKAFIAFITAGYPDLKTTEKLLLEFDKVGVDIVELGVPFSDPLADGPMIQESSQKALEKNTHLSQIFALVKRARRQTDIPVCLMTYYNPVFCFGEEKFIQACVACGVDGVIIPDLPPEESATINKLADQHKIDIIRFISPTTSKERIRRVAQSARGFIYYVSLTGVTGSRTSLSADLIDNLKAIRRLTKKPLCVGFGVSTAAQARDINRFADGVIVGSAIVQKIKENIHRTGLTQTVSKFVLSLKG
ncbi:MAG: tryptophan synthase subunit alpha [Candidatus Omnitrophica bacterium]|nr:tryptophan synthase subunit alpha [Candidatus Omnitrophota bacterium]